ncbi:helix-turn-helix domain-containing protein [Niallia circulans]|uniref:helix-turn-helix domain-containing protein n=2 Tax=Niallia TaxID=2837506 RepID=UPI0035A06EC7
MLYFRIFNPKIRSGASLMDTATLFRISSYTIVHDWRKKMEACGLDALEPNQRGIYKSMKVYSHQMHN